MSKSTVFVLVFLIINNAVAWFAITKLVDRIGILDTKLQLLEMKVETIKQYLTTT